MTIALPSRDALAGYWRSATPMLARAVLSPFVAGSELPWLSGSSFQPVSFSGDPLDGYRSELIATLDAIRRRLWVYRSLVLALRTLVLAAGLYLVSVVLESAGLLGQPNLVLAIAALTALAGLALVARQRLSYLDTARVVDRQLGLKAQLGTAVELTLAGQTGQVARSQVRQATAIARRLQPSQAIAFRVPWRDLRLLGGIVLAAAVVWLAASLGLQAPATDTAAAASRAALDPDMNSWYELDPARASQLTADERRQGGVQGVVERLRQQLDKKEITSLEYASQVAAAQDQVRQQAEESARQQAALSNLADALSDASSTRGLAESLDRGDYAQAVQELVDLGDKSDRLSPQARQELAARLRDAAQRTADGSSGLAGAADRAAAALDQGDPAAAKEALRELASAVASASQSVAPQADLGDALQQLQQADGQEGSSSDGPEGPGDLAGAADQPGASSGRGAPTAGGDYPQTESAPSGDRAAGEAASPGSDRGGGAGSGSGDRIATYGPQNRPAKPDPTGNLLKVSGRAGAAGTSVRSEGPGSAPLTSSAGGSSSVRADGTAVRSDELVTAAGETNYVPLELRPVVKDYFSGGDRP